MFEENNTDVMNHVMNSFFKVISTRTTPAHAWLTLKKMIGKLTYNYNFLENIYVVEIKNIKEMEYYNTNIKSIVNIESNVIDNVNRNIIGKLIQSFADEIIKYLGKKAGYHLLCEFRYDLGDEYFSIIKSMGVDLHLDTLEYDLYGYDNEKDLIEKKNNKENEILSELI